MGSLIEGGRDLTGQLYMRNRFYDPHSGKFTQEDPIGIAGGLNVYGFGNSDPVNFSDPYGLSAEESCPPCLIGLVWLGENMLTVAAVGTFAVELGLPAGEPSPGAAISAIGQEARQLARAAITSRRVRGLAAEAQVAEDLVKEGNTILGSHVTVVTSLGRRVIDHLVRGPGGDIFAVEVKSGRAVRNASQVAKDAEMATEGAVVIGKNAPQEMQGAKATIPTVVRQVP
jgi:RHS repeat-associated protein